MSTIRKTAALVLLPAALLLTGCISFQAHPAGIEASARHMYSPDYELLGDAEGMSSSFRLFWVFAVTPAASCREAVEDAIKSRGGDNLIEATFTEERMIYIVGTVTNIYAKGKVIRYIRNKNQR